MESLICITQLSVARFPSHLILIINSEVDKAGHIIFNLQMRKSRPNGVKQLAKGVPVYFSAKCRLEIESVSINLV